MCRARLGLRKAVISSVLYDCKASAVVIPVESFSRRQVCYVVCCEVQRLLLLSGYRLHPYLNADRSTTAERVDLNHN